MSRDEITRQRDVALVDLVDRLLGGGVVITGDITLSLADVDLVYLNLKLLVSSVSTLLEESGEPGGDSEPARLPPPSEEER
jgi:hypothetical protein